MICCARCPMKPVLYAEDEPDDAFFMQRAWKDAGAPNALVILKDGQQIIDYLAGDGAFADRQAHPLPCLLLLDLNLPFKSGFEVFRWIRSHPTLRSLKVVVVSSSSQESDTALARSLGAIDYVVKPSAPRGLLEIIRQRKHLWLDAHQAPPPPPPPQV